MKIKMLFLLSILNTVLYASCKYDLNIDFDFKNSKIDVNANIYNSSKSLELKYKEFDIKDVSKLQQSLNNGANRVSFFYSKKIEGLDSRFIYLLDNWYPKIKNRCTYTINSTLPLSYKSIYEKTDKAIDKVSFVASKDFVIHQKIHNKILLKTYFLTDNSKLSQEYLNKSIEYITLYEKMIGTFPFKEFSIVENIYQTGYSMPTFTLIGSRLLKKPYILEQSLGHEILHQYFGNAVFNDFEKGNWIEGLTTYLADDYYKKLSNNDINHRKTVLNEYSNFVNQNKEFAIADFKFRFDKASMLIGYSKLAFVFHMLENKIGAEAFNTIIRKLYKEYQFKEMNLNNLAQFFDNNSTVNLKAFFKQWFYSKGEISFEIKEPNTFYDKNGFWLEFNVVQDKNNFFQFDLPLSINTYDKTINKIININQYNQKVKLNFNSEILNIVFDKNINLFRKLSKKEKPLSIASLMVEKDLVAIVNKEKKAKYQSIKKIFPNIKIINSDDVKFKDLKENSVLFLDTNNSVLSHVYPNINIEKENSYLNVKPHIYNKEKTMSILNFGLYKHHYFRMLKHYSKYKEIVFTKNSVDKTFDETVNGININLNQLPHIEKIEKKSSIKNILENIKDTNVIYVGESHNNFAHHLNQLRVIKALHESGKKVSIAMEMFQMPFQKDLDEYVQGKTTLEVFLKNSQYFKRWKFDYNLYKPIMDYARTNKLPIVALNIDRSVTKEAARKGLFALNAEQKKLLPKRIDQSNLEYKKSLNEIFKQHTTGTSAMPKNNPHSAHQLNLDFYYHSQLIWDEIMAENIAKYMKNNPNKVVVVLAGSGHIQNHDGIPSRVYNRNTLPYTVLLNDVSSSKVGDILIQNSSQTSMTKASKLGTYLKSENELIVLNTVQDSLAQKLGIKKSDKLTKINEEPIQTISDIKRVLYFVKSLEDISVTVERKTKTLELKTKH